METERSEMKRMRYNIGDAEFILEPLSDSVVKVAHRDQTGYFGMHKDWDARYPYTFTTYRSDVIDSGIDGRFSRATLERALDSLCSAMLSDQSKLDSRRINPEGRKRAARLVMKEFLKELPN